MQLHKPTLERGPPPDDMLCSSSSWYHPGGSEPDEYKRALPSGTDRWEPPVEDTEEWPYEGGMGGEGVWPP